MSQVSVVWNPVQWGFDAGGIWSDNFQMGLSPAGPGGGMIFDANNHQSLRFVTVGGDTRIIDGPLLLGFVLECDSNRGPATTSPATVELGLVPDPQPEDYSTALLPWTRGEVSLGTFTFTVPVTPATVVATFVLSADAVTLMRAHVVCSSRWNGRMAVSVRNVDPVITAALRLFHPGATQLAIATTSQENQWFSGLQGGPYGGRARYVRDSRFGMPALNTELVRDGDQPGLWVRPWDSDPEDEPTRYRPRPGEGTVNDDINT